MKHPLVGQFVFNNDTNVCQITLQSSTDPRDGNFLSCLKMPPY